MNIAIIALVQTAPRAGAAYRQSSSGQVAVGAMILNRSEHPSFPNTLSGVIYQPGAFSCIDDGQFRFWILLITTIGKHRFCA